MEHEKFKAGQIQQFKAAVERFKPAIQEMSSGLFQWFSHMGFWRADQLALNFEASMDPEAKITITLREYIALKKAEKIALIHSEVSEMLEAVRNGDSANEAEEWADMLVRMLDYRGGFEVPGELAFEAKQLKNYERPYKHGKKF